MKRAITCLLFLLALGACGGGGTANTAGNTSGPAPADNKAAPANLADGSTGDDGRVDPPKEDSEKYKKLSGAMPAGWHTLKTHVKKELERHIKPVPADWKFVSGVVNNEAPGASERAEKWAEWEKQAAGAMLYFVTDKAMTAREAVEAHAKNLAAGVPEISATNDVAWTQMQGGEVLVFGISNKLGTYVAVGVVLTAEPEPAREAIQKWAESIKPE